jgi:hypothetical protein
MFSILLEIILCIEDLILHPIRYYELGEIEEYDFCFVVRNLEDLSLKLMFAFKLNPQDDIKDLIQKAKQFSFFADENFTKYYEYFIFDQYFFIFFDFDGFCTLKERVEFLKKNGTYFTEFVFFFFFFNFFFNLMT